MDLFHIKIFKKPKQILSVVYSVQSDAQKSHFVKVQQYQASLYQPGIDPVWIDEVLSIQKSDLQAARKFVFNIVEKEIREYKSSISVGFDWDVSDYQCDEFMSHILKFVGFE